MKSKNQNQDLINLNALITATKYIDAMLRNQDEFVTFTDIPTLQVHPGNLNVQQLLLDAEEPLKEVQLPNVQLLQQMVEEIINTKTEYAFPWSKMFLPPVQTKIARTYYQTIPVPMCFAYVKFRLMENVIEQTEVQNTGFSSLNQLLNVKLSSYGSIHEQRPDFEDKDFSGDACRKIFRSLNKKPKPYRTLEEVAVDMILIACNCCFFNSNDVMGMVQEGRKLLDRVIRALKQYFDIQIIPEWVVNCTDNTALKQLREHLDLHAREHNETPYE